MACHEKWLLKNERDAVCFFDAIRCVCSVKYKAEARDAMHKYKFNGKFIYSEPFGSMLAESVSLFGGAYTCVTWAPLSKKRLRERGYDQCRPLAEAVSKAAGLPLRELLVKKKHNPSQNTLETDAERADNVSGVFALRDGADVLGERILLVDDIVTSGATLTQIAKLLLDGGAESVECAVLARSR